MIDGVQCKIDLSQPSRSSSRGALIDRDVNRIVDLTFNGEPLDLDPEFVIATSNRRASGGGNFPGADGSTIVFEAPDTNRDVIVRYIVDQGTIDPADDANW